MRPLGISPYLTVTHPSAAQDAIWEAVKAAREAGMTPAQFISEAREAWEEEAREELKHDLDQFRRA